MPIHMRMIIRMNIHNFTRVRVRIRHRNIIRNRLRIRNRNRASGIHVATECIRIRIRRRAIVAMRIRNRNSIIICVIEFTRMRAVTIMCIIVIVCTRNDHIEKQFVSQFFSQKMLVFLYPNLS